MCGSRYGRRDGAETSYWDSDDRHYASYMCRNQSLSQCSPSFIRGGLSWLVVSYAWPVDRFQDKAAVRFTHAKRTAAFPSDMNVLKGIRSAAFALAGGRP